MRLAMSTISLAGLVGSLAFVAPSVAPAGVNATELATAHGAIAIREAPLGQRSPTCSELIVEARDALDNHLIGLTHAEIDAAGACRYAISVPAQNAVWLHVRPVLVDSERIAASDGHAVAGNASARSVAPPATRERLSSGSVQLRFRIVAPETYFFTPGERKAIGLSY